MPNYPREELEKMVSLWLEANKKAEAECNWQRHLGPMYTDEAEYFWNVGPNEEFVARGRQEIEQWALGEQMEGFEGWQYPYQSVLIDEKLGEVVAFWKQIAPARRSDGSAYEVAGLGGSWFRYGGEQKWCWQTDFFDFGNVMALLLELAADGHLNAVIKEKIQKVARGRRLSGHIKRPHSPTVVRRVKCGFAMARIAAFGR